MEKVKIMGTITFSGELDPDPSNAAEALRRARLRSHHDAGKVSITSNTPGRVDALPSPVSQDHTGIQLRPSKQENVPSETGGRCGNVRRTIPIQPRSGSGQQAALSARSRQVRCISVSRHRRRIVGTSRFVPQADIADIACGQRVAVTQTVARAPGSFRLMQSAQ
jgi:hypothetical protein